jgi:phage major head subunit gpT-like protein
MVTRDALQALTEFSEAFDGQLVAAEPETWAESLGFAVQSEAIKTTFPIPLSQAGFRERIGDDVLRALYEKSLSVIPRQWQDGVKAPSRVIEKGDFIGWASEPQRIATAWRQLQNDLVAAMLEANPLLDLYRIERPGGSVASTIHLFDASHPVCIGDTAPGTFDNDLAASALDSALLEALDLYFSSIDAPNGKPMGLRLRSILVPSALRWTAKKLLEQDTLIDVVLNGATPVGGIPRPNLHKGVVSWAEAIELTSSTVIYAFAGVGGGAGPAPWVTQTQPTPEEIRYDKDSDFWKNTGDVAVKYVGDAGVVAALPHGIARVTIS